MARKSKLELPRRLINRNPFDKLDVEVARNITAQVWGQNITPITKRELLAEGVDLDKIPHKVKVIRSPKDDDEICVLGAFYSPFDRLKRRFPTKVVSCNNCQALLLVSAQQDINVAKFLCCFCAADEALDYYWKKEDKRSQQRSKRRG